RLGPAVALRAGQTRLALATLMRPNMQHFPASRRHARPNRRAASRVVPARSPAPAAAPQLAHLLTHRATTNLTALPTMFVIASCAIDNVQIPMDLRPMANGARGTRARESVHGGDRADRLGKEFAGPTAFGPGAQGEVDDAAQVLAARAAGGLDGDAAQE